MGEVEYKLASGAATVILHALGETTHNRGLSRVHVAYHSYPGVVIRPRLLALLQLLKFFGLNHWHRNLSVVVIFAFLLVVLIGLGGLSCVGIILRLLFVVSGSVLVMHFLYFVEHGLQRVLFRTSL